MQNNRYRIHNIKFELLGAMPKTHTTSMDERVIRLWTHGFKSEEIADVSGFTLSDVEHVIAQHKKHALAEKNEV